MSIELTYLVEPKGRSWLIRLSGDNQSELTDSRDGAIVRARQLAAQHEHARVVVLAEDGSVNAEYGVHASSRAERPRR